MPKRIPSYSRMDQFAAGSNPQILVSVPILPDFPPALWVCRWNRIPGQGYGPRPRVRCHAIPICMSSVESDQREIVDDHATHHIVELIEPIADRLLNAGQLCQSSMRHERYIRKRQGRRSARFAEHFSGEQAGLSKGVSIRNAGQTRAGPHPGSSYRSPSRARTIPGRARCRRGLRRTGPWRRRCRPVPRPCDRVPARPGSAP